MKVINPNHPNSKFRRRSSMVGGLLLLLIVLALFAKLHAAPLINPPVWGTNRALAQLNVANCSDTNFLTQRASQTHDFASK